MTHTTPLSDVQFYDRLEYFTELQHAAERSKPGDEMLVMAMDFSPKSPTITAMMKAFCDAARRGVNVQFVIDAHSFIAEDHQLGPLWYGTSLDAKYPHGGFNAILDSLRELEAAGGAYHVINRPAKRFSNPFGGRSHIKLAVINDRVFIGGCNLERPQLLDVMIAWEDAPTASWLRGLVERICQAPTARQAMEYTDIERRISDSATIIVDAGVKQQSQIIRQARMLIDEAQEFVIITCQYFPGGITANHLLAAHKRGVAVTIYFSPPSTHNSQAPGHWLYNNAERLRLPKAFFAHEIPADRPKLHAKILASEKAAMIGSHNYVQAGVNFGTAEIALRSEDPDFITATQRHVARLVGDI